MRPACKVVWVLAAPLLGACAAGAQRNQLLVSQPASAGEPAAVSATAANHGATAPSHASAFNAELIKKGYQPMRRGNKLLYCRSERTTGSLIPTTACLTESQIRWLEQQNEQQAKDLQTQPRGGRNCPRGTSNCVGNGG